MYGNAITPIFQSRVLLCANNAYSGNKERELQGLRTCQRPGSKKLPVSCDRIDRYANRLASGSLLSECMNASCCLLLLEAN
jgi:hypothetical protein